jgi:acetolactate synthase-1/2/3 large subunit
MNGAESLIRTARAAGIDVCFANPGTTEMPLVVALDRVPGIRPVLGLFEGVCTGAADGYGRMAGRPALTLLHLGPGLANGLANLHNARKAHTPLVNLVGEHATWHLQVESPLRADIEGPARSVGWVRASSRAGALGADLADAIAAAQQPPGQVATLIVPADLQSAPAEAAAEVAKPVAAAPPEERRIGGAVSALRGGRTTALLIGGSACRAEALRGAARIADATGCRLWVETFPARMERGAGTPRFERFPYFPEQVQSFCAGVERVVLAGAHDPMAMFGWPGAASRMLPAGVEIVPLAERHEDAAQGLAAVAEGLAAPPQPKNLAPREPAARRSGALDLAALGAAVSALLPEHAVVVDEGATSSAPLYASLATAAPHTWLTLTGGAIGQGLPCATGAAVASPDRKVLSFQADGSGLYTVQALWTQARESLDVTTIVCANRAYRILQIELHRAGVGEPGPAARLLTDLGSPPLDWVSLAQGLGVPAVRVLDADALARELERALAEPGPRLIEAVLG